MENFISDKELYKSYLNGNDKDFIKLIMQYKENLMYFILKYVKNKEVAEDIFQDTIVYLLENKEKYNLKYSFKTYLYMVAKSFSLNYLKRNKRIQHNELDYNVADKENLEDNIFLKDKQRKIRKALNKLPEDYQLAIYLTQIEEFSYNETAKIMNKNVSQIKNLVHRGKAKLRKILLEEKVVEIKNNKLINLLSTIIIIGVLSTTVVYASIKIYEYINSKNELVATYNSNKIYEDINTMWVGSFQLAWNEFMDNVIGGEVKFENKKSDLLNELNEKNFTKDNLNEDDYYIKVGKTTPELKETILDDLGKKFNITDRSMLNDISFENKDSAYTIYSILNKEFEFLTPFDTVEASSFKNSEEKFEYFGIEAGSSEELNNNVNVLFYNSNEDFAVTLNTKENEEVILYRTNNEDTFENTYNTLKEKSGENSKFNENDELKIPVINMDMVISYEELCGKYISGTNGMYISNALQNVKFNLNKFGGNLTSESYIEETYFSDYEVGRQFYFTDRFYVFLKEKDKNMPYMALVVDNSDILR